MTGNRLHLVTAGRLGVTITAMGNEQRGACAGNSQANGNGPGPLCTDDRKNSHWWWLI